MPAFNFALATLGAVATASSSASGYLPEQVIDDSDITYWRCVSSASPVWLKVDLGAPQYIETVHLHALSGNFSSGLTLSYSLDDATYLTLASIPSPSGVGVDYPTDGITARYWQISGLLLAARYVTLAAFELWGPVTAPPPPENPATDYINAWLDGIEANFVPDVQAWLDAH